jgi:primosomal protein N' (replication factor Y)
MPSKCPSCTSNQLITIGAGTEKIEESLKLLLPEARVARMDLDTTRRKNAFQELFDRFSNHEIDILVGTQMLTKGLNFGNVELVGVFDADTMLHFPNFRAIEKSFQTMMQVSGRAGRQSDQGQVIIQTYSVNHPIFQYILANNYTQFYERELGDRKQYLYPPYTRIIHLSILHPEKSEAQNMGNELSFMLKQQIEPTNLLGPQLASIEKLRNLFHVEMYIKMERQQKNSSQIKWYIQRCIDMVMKNKIYTKGKIIIDIDAY